MSRAAEAFTAEALAKLRARTEPSIRVLLACRHAALHRAHSHGEPRIGTSQVLSGDDTLARD